jgi:hypothetical protein
MRTSLFAFAWTFVLAVAAYDVYFAWQYRAVFHAWELNPIARWAADLCGLGAVFGIKAAFLAFALGVAIYCHRCRHRLAIPYTLTIGGAHFALSLQYLLA